MLPSVDLVRALCHDVGNLLAAIRLSGHLLRSDIGDKDRHSIAGDVEELAAEAGALLAHVRPLLAGAHVARIPVSPAEVLRAVSSALKDRRIGGAELSITQGRNLPDVRADPDALYHLLLTLVRGSLGAADPDGRVRISAKHEGRRLILSVIDDGRPVDLDEVRRAPAPRGRELTLRVADTVLRRMGGRAEVEPRRRGTRIDLFLPAMAVRRA